VEGLKDKVIVFAGAGGIATATARYLGAGGAKVVVGDVVLASAEGAARTCGDAGGKGVATVGDISDEEQVKALIAPDPSSGGVTGASGEQVDGWLGLQVVLEQVLGGALHVRAPVLLCRKRANPRYRLPPRAGMICGRSTVVRMPGAAAHTYGTALTARLAV